MEIEHLVYIMDIDIAMQCFSGDRTSCLYHGHRYSNYIEDIDIAMQCFSGDRTSCLYQGHRYSNAVFQWR